MRELGWGWFITYSRLIAYIPRVEIHSKQQLPHHHTVDTDSPHAGNNPFMQDLESASTLFVAACTTFTCVG